MTKQQAWKRLGEVLLDTIQEYDNLDFRIICGEESNRPGGSIPDQHYLRRIIEALEVLGCDRALEVAKKELKK